MKYIKNTFCAILILVVLCISNLSIFAHSDILNVDYDDCIVPTNSFGNIICDDGEDECWYILNARW